MALKAAPSIFNKRPRRKERSRGRRRGGFGGRDLVVGATGAIIGTAFVTQTAGLIRSL